MEFNKSARGPIAAIFNFMGCWLTVIGLLTIFNVELDLSLEILNQPLPKDKVTGIVLLVMGVSSLVMGHVLEPKNKSKV